MSYPSQPLTEIFRISATPREWFLLVLCIVLSLVLAFWPDVTFGRWVINHLGYWQMVLLLIAAAVFVSRDAACESRIWRRWWRRGAAGRPVAGLILLGGAVVVFAHLHFPHRFKILADEAVLVNTSQALQQHRLIYTPTSGAHRNGIFVVSDGYIDKRPYFHPFVVSLVHDLTGFRWNNAIWLNMALTLPVFAGFFFLGRRLQRHLGGAVAVGAAAGVPILAQTLTGGGFEPLNVLLVLVTLLAALRYNERPSLDRLGVLVSVGLMLAYTRYESGLYLVAVGACIWWALARKGTGRIPWPLYFAPLLCVPLVWLQLIAFNDEYHYFQLAVNQDPSAFGVRYLARNLASAWRYFAVPNEANLSSPLVWAMGVLGSVVLAWRCPRVRRYGSAANPILVAFVGVTLANVAVFLFLNYGQYSQYITQRISVPVWGILVLLGVSFVARLPRRFGAWVGGGLIGVNLVVFYFPAANGDFHGREYTPVLDFEFTRSTLEQARDPHGVLVYSHMPTNWISLQRPSIGFREAVKDKQQVLKVLRTGEYAHVWVHALSCSSQVALDAGARRRLQTPLWFADIDKRLVAEHWLGNGITSRIYEVLLPEQNGGALPAARTTGDPAQDSSAGTP